MADKSLLLVLFFKNFSFFKMICFSFYPLCFRNCIIMWWAVCFCPYSDFVFDKHFQFKDSPSTERYIKKKFLSNFLSLSPTIPFCNWFSSFLPPPFFHFCSKVYEIFPLLLSFSLIYLKIIAVIFLIFNRCFPDSFLHILFLLHEKLFSFISPRY